MQEEIKIATVIHLEKNQLKTDWERHICVV